MAVVTTASAGANVPDVVSLPWTIAALLIFLIKHLFADFFLQTAWMASGKEQPQGWLYPLLAHVAVHAVATLVIFLALAPAYWGLAIVDFAIHFAIDRGKGLLNRAFDNDPSKTAFWWLIGIDQTLHHLTHLGFAMVIAVARTVYA